MEELTKMIRDAPVRSAPPPGPYPADKARGGEIILKTPLQRWIFIAGLAATVAVALALALLGAQ